MNTLKVHADNTLTLVEPTGRTIHVGRIDKDSHQMPSGQRGKSTVTLKNSKAFTATAPLWVPSVAGSASDWKVNPDFVSEIEAHLND